MTDKFILKSGVSAGVPAEPSVSAPAPSPAPPSAPASAPSPAPYFSRDGRVLPVREATVSLFDINYAYGYGVYETLKLRRGVLYFADRHCERLLHSAEVIGIAIPWSAAELEAQIRELIAANKRTDANIKIMCVGDSRSRSATSPPSTTSPSATTPPSPNETHAYILMLNPLFPPRRLYSRGATAITAEGERHFPTAKTLDMLLSATLYRRAMQAGAYDTILINPARRVTEGTRTNIFVTDGHALYTPPRADTLMGVTKSTVIACALEAGIAVHERPLPWQHFHEWQGVFLTSTSSKIVPVVKVDTLTFDIPPLIKELIKQYNAYLTRYAEKHGTIITSAKR